VEQDAYGLGGSESQVDASAAATSEQISSGIASEVRSELTEAADENEPNSSRIERIERALEDLQDTLSAQLRRPTREPQQTSTDALAETVRGLPVEARALMAILLRGRHLSRKEYRSAVQNEELKAPIRVLRSAGILMPLEGIEDGEPVPVYHLAPWLARRLRVASQLAGDVPHEVLAHMSDSLSLTGYHAKS
jgi:hypothetical protein